MKDARKMFLGLSLGVVAALALASLARAACYDECENCAADPVFIQADRRSPEMIPAVRQARAKGWKVVEFDDGTTVIIGDPSGGEACGACTDKTAGAIIHEEGRVQGNHEKEGE